MLQSIELHVQACGAGEIKDQCHSLISYKRTICLLILRAHSLGFKKGAKLRCVADLGAGFTGQKFEVNKLGLSRSAENCREVALVWKQTCSRLTIAVGDIAAFSSELPNEEKILSLLCSDLSPTREMVQCAECGEGSPLFPSVFAIGTNRPPR